MDPNDVNQASETSSASGASSASASTSPSEDSGTSKTSGASGTSRNSQPSAPCPYPVPPVPGGSTPLPGFDVSDETKRILARLKDLHMSGMKNALVDELEATSPDEAAAAVKLLSRITIAETDLRASKRQAKLMKDAGLQIPSACPEDIAFNANRQMDRDILASLTSCSFIKNRKHAAILGATGSGKTYIACAVATAACRKGYSCRFVRLPDLLNEFTFSRETGDFNKVRSNYARKDLIVIDEWLLRPLPIEESYELLEIIDACSRTSSMIFCSQYLPADWYKRIDCDRPKEDNSTIADAILDRIIHNSHVLMLESKESMRKYYADAQ